MLRPDVPSTASRAEWFAARALLASRRLRAFVPVGLTVFVIVFVTVLAARRLVKDRPPSTGRPTAGAFATPRDTFRLVAELRTARAELTERDSAVQVLLSRMETTAAVPPLAPASQHERDSLRTVLVQLDGALNRATKAPLVASYRALAGAKAMRSVTGVRELVDSLDQIDRVRLTLDPSETPQREFAELTLQSNALGERLQEIGQAQRGALVRQIAVIDGDATSRAGRPVAVESPTVTRAARDSARTRVDSADAHLHDARQWNATMRARADSAENVRGTYLLGSSPLALAFAALVVAGVLIFALAVAAEARRPTVANAREVERIVGIPVLGVAHPGHLPGQGRARLRPVAGIDPFRMEYLALTASGTRERAVCVTGDDADLVAAVAGRLAVNAAIDARATLLVDIAPGTPSASRYFDERTEPGFSEAIAAVRLWREVARPLGASEGLGLDLVPPGARRPDTVESVAMASNRSEFLLFASEYDFTAIAAPTREALATVARLYDRPATIFVVRVAKTPLDAMAADVLALQGLALDLHGIMLVDNSH